MLIILNAGVGILRFLAFVGGLLIFFGILSIVLYFLYSFGIYKMGQKAGIKHSWLAFIPPLNLYIMGKIIGPNRLKVFDYEVKNPELVMSLTPFAMWLGAAIFSGKLSVISTLITIAGIIFLLICNYEFLKIYKGEEAKTLFIVSIFIPFVWPFIIFKLRNVDPIDDVYSNYSYDYYNNYDDYGYYDNNDYYDGY